MKPILYLGQAALHVVGSFALTFVAAFIYMPRLHKSPYENFGYMFWTLLPASVACLGSLISAALALTLDQPAGTRMRNATLWATCCFLAVNLLNALYIWAVALWGPPPSSTI